MLKICGKLGSKTRWILGLISFLSARAFADEHIPVFYSTMLPADARQKTLNDALAKDGLNLSVFAKYQDFIADVTSSNANVIIAPSVFGKYTNQYEAVMQFANNSQTSRKYLAVSLNSDWKAERAPNTKIGVVEETDRTNLKEFTSTLTKLEFKQVKSVTKAEDLFPMLMFKFTDLICIDPDEYTKLKEKFTTPTHVVLESQPIEYPQIFVKKNTSDKQALSALKALPEDTLKTLGFTHLNVLKDWQK